MAKLVASGQFPGVRTDYATGLFGRLWCRRPLVGWRWLARRQVVAVCRPLICADLYLSRQMMGFRSDLGRTHSHSHTNLNGPAMPGVASSKLPMRCKVLIAPT